MREHRCRSEYLYGLHYQDRRKDSERFRKHGGSIRAKSLLDALTPDIVTPDWSWRWESTVVPQMYRGMPAYYQMFDGYYQLVRKGRVVANWHGPLIVPHLYAAKWSGAKLQKTKPLPLP